MDILLSALAGAQQELLLLEGHALAGRWKEAEFTDNVEAGLLRYGSSLRDAKEKVFNLKVKLSQVKLDAAAAAAGAPPGPFGGGAPGRDGEGAAPQRARGRLP